MQKTFGAEHVDLGWRYLQIDDLRGADREFAAALKSNPEMYPAHAGHGFVALARRDFDRAVAAFDAALGADRIVCSGARRPRPGAARAAPRRRRARVVRSGARLDPSLTDVRQRAEVLRFRGVQDLIETARAAAKSGRVPEARAAYERAIAASPESAFLYRELGVLERRAGNMDQALSRLRRATELDPLDATAFVQLAELLESRQDFAGAERRIARRSNSIRRRSSKRGWPTVAKNAREAQLPPEFKAALSAAQITRGDLAAIIGVRLESIVAAAPTRQVVMTDTRGHWAAPWIAEVAEAGIMPPFENHTFQPNAAVRRGDLAVAISRVLTAGRVERSGPPRPSRRSARPSPT